MFSLKHVEKAMVLLCFRSKSCIWLWKSLCQNAKNTKMLKNHWFYCIFGPKNCIFSENPCAKMQKNKKVKNTCVFIWFFHQSEKQALVLLWKMLKKSKNHCKASGFLKKRVVKPISGNGFGPWNSHTRLDKLWGTLTDKLFREKYL